MALAPGPLSEPTVPIGAMRVGDDPNITDFLRAVALVSHRAKHDFDGVQVVLSQSETERLVPLLRALDAAYRVVIEHLLSQKEAQELDDGIRALMAAEVVEHLDTYNRLAAEAIVAMRA